MLIARHGARGLHRHHPAADARHVLGTVLDVLTLRRGRPRQHLAAGRRASASSRS
ncbi:MAG: hypothetical protein MZV49_08790 [Rhodopseudomonas palustris]|nr:hypothetical protein [Rhodopseudomonas palustris]